MIKGSPAPEVFFKTLADALYAAGASATGGEIGLVFVDLQERETRISWREVERRARHIARGLRARGVRSGDHVAIVIPTSPQFCDAFFGCVISGAVPVPLYPPVRLGRLDEWHASTARMILAASARLVIADRRFKQLLGTVLSCAQPQLGCTTAEDLADEAPLADVPRREPGDIGLVQFSSGTTVDPKPVALSHANVLAQCATLSAAMASAPGGHEPVVGVCWLPLYHDMGLVGCLLTALYLARPMVLIPPEHFLTRPALWLRAISRHRGTVSPAPDFAYAVCVQRIRNEDLRDVDLSSWRFALDGAEPISPETLRSFVDRFQPSGFRPSSLLPVYGLAEATLAVTFSPPRERPKTLQVDAALLARTGEVAAGSREMVSVGSPVPGVAIEIRDPAGRLLPESRAGEIFVSGPSVMTGYFQGPAATAEALREGWLKTGDLGFVHGGELYLHGRAKDLIIIRGANHTPQEFEECLDGLAGIRPGCAVALGFVPPGGGGEKLLILAERSSERVEGLKEPIRNVVLSRTGIAPDTIELLEPGTLPRTSSGKKRRSEALRRYLAGELRPPKRIRPWTVWLEMLRASIRLRVTGRVAPDRRRRSGDEDRRDGALRERQHVARRAVNTSGAEASKSLVPPPDS